MVAGVATFAARQLAGPQAPEGEASPGAGTDPGVGAPVPKGRAVEPDDEAVLVPHADIGIPPGPLHSIAIGADLSCQVHRLGDRDGQWYPPDAPLADCGTLLWDGTALHAPAFALHKRTATSGLGDSTAYAQVSQAPYEGASPSLRRGVVTVVRAGALVVSQDDGYVAGEDVYTTEVNVTNPGPSPVEVRLWRAGDCYLQDDDFSHGFLGGPAGAVGCSRNAHNSPIARIEQFIPVTPGSRHFEHHHDTLWQRIGKHAAFDGTCRCASRIDSAAGLSWDLAIAPGGSVVVVSRTRYSPTGELPVEPTTPSGPGEGTGPRVAVSASQDGPCGTMVPVQFRGYATGDGEGLSWSWEFGDGAASHERDPLHPYHEPGPYLVSLTVRDGAGLATTRSWTVHVRGPEECGPPQAHSNSTTTTPPPRDGVDAQEAERNTDGDAHPDRADNCPAFANDRQEDMDRDGRGDACDDDRDGDDVPDAWDPCVAPAASASDCAQTAAGAPAGSECDPSDPCAPGSRPVQPAPAVERARSGIEVAGPAPTGVPALAYGALGAVLVAAALAITALAVRRSRISRDGRVGPEGQGRPGHRPPPPRRTR